ncbi:MAG: PhnD/SsuA/transferrin family substrate-binding protein, partial [Crocosphaera sp.]|uniref:PhnD/SsuA/transferrin family substrate-binding protein n=1 Tax=Crocosphaera sp. TaxID=2729996 RepID=UPI0025912765
MLLTSIQWVISGRVDAMTMGSVDFEKLPEETQQQFIIIGETRSVPRHMLVVSPTLSKNKITRLNPNFSQNLRSPNTEALQEVGLNRAI